MSSETTDDDQSLAPSSSLESADVAAGQDLELQQLVRVEQYSGPIPHPSIVERYEAILPGSFDRVLAMAEQQQDARLQLERQRHHDKTAMEKQRHSDAVLIHQSALASFSARERVGMWLGFLLALAILLIAALVILTGRSLEAGIALVIGDAIAIAGVFLFTQRSSSNETKSSENP